jgi:hypothetical protein
MIAMHARSFDEFIEALESTVVQLKRWRTSGKVELDPNGVQDDYATFVTYDPVFADIEGFAVTLDEVDED